jgi:hypothetical protein
MVRPLGLATQHGLAEDGSGKVKHRLTQDLSFSLTEPKMSVNSRMDMDQHPVMFHGWCISRNIHFIVSLRLACPERRMFISKWTAATLAREWRTRQKRQLNQSQSCWQSQGESFGGSPNPPSWCLFSEMATDLANETANSSSCDLKTLTSPSQPETRGFLSPSPFP